MTDTDHRPAEVREQAQQQADQARASMQEKRDKQDGRLGGWVAKRVGEWDLSGQDETTLQRQKFFWNGCTPRSAAVYVPSVRSGYAVTCR
jgi:hypothetical protein